MCWKQFFLGQNGPSSLPMVRQLGLLTGLRLLPAILAFRVKKTANVNGSKHNGSCNIYNHNYMYIHINVMNIIFKHTNAQMVSKWNSTPRLWARKQQSPTWPFPFDSGQSVLLSCSEASAQKFQLWPGPPSISHGMVDSLNPKALQWGLKLVQFQGLQFQVVLIHKTSLYRSI